MTIKRQSTYYTTGRIGFYYHVILVRDGKETIMPNKYELPLDAILKADMLNNAHNNGVIIK